MNTLPGLWNALSGNAARSQDPSKGFASVTEVLPLHHFDAEFHYSPRYGYVYISVPKAACSTMKLTLQRMELDDPDYQPERIHGRKGSPLVGPLALGAERVRELLSSPSVLKFTFVRNPYTRLLSGYLDKIARRSEGRAGRLRALGFDPETRPKDLPFALFVKRVAEQSDYEMNPHWRPQVSQLLFDRVRYDFIGRIENFEEDLARLDQLLGGRVRPHYSLRNRHGTGAGMLLRKHYDSETRRRVRRRFAADFEALGYDPRFRTVVKQAAA